MTLNLPVITCAAGAITSFMFARYLQKIEPRIGLRVPRTGSVEERKRRFQIGIRLMFLSVIVWILGALAFAVWT
jgi:hypothetical protein